ncbi:MAG: hypothetical protein ABI857_05190 [Acidobacteriota bacterium]
MIACFVKLIICAAIFSGLAAVAYAQSDFPDASSRSGRRQRDDKPQGINEMLAKQKAERDRKEHEALLERGEEALRLTNQLETSFTRNRAISQQDKGRLESLEKVVTKIRKELGGGNDSGERDDSGFVQSVSEPRPSTIEEAFEYLRSTTVTLVDELRKTTRFSISVVAIQSSNTVLKLVRFLRIKK